MLTSASSALKSQTKRLQDSANRSALEAEAQQLTVLSETLNALQTTFAGMHSTSPDAESLRAACALLRSTPLRIQIHASVCSKLLSLSVAQSCLYRQYREACCYYDTDNKAQGHDIREMEKQWSRGQVEEFAAADMSTRLTSLVRNIPMADVPKAQSDAKEQVFALAEAIESSDAGLLRCVKPQARLARAFVFPGRDLESTCQAIERVDAFAKLTEGAQCPDASDEDARPMLQFLV